MKQILKTKGNIVELHERLNEFARHHHNKGGQEALLIIKEMWDKTKATERDVSSVDVSYYKGLDDTFKSILDTLHKRFVP